MARVPVFYSFHYDSDVFRVQQVRNMGVVDGNAPVSVNNWEQVKRQGDAAVKRWIDENMKYRRCVVVLIGSETASRKWVKHEIKRAWEKKKGLFGIYIHNLRCPQSGTCAKGANPFDNWSIDNQSMANIVECFDPSSRDTYGEISRNLEGWVDSAIQGAQKR